MKTNRAFNTVTSLNSCKPRRAVNNTPVQLLPRPGCSQDSLSSITSTDDSEVYVEEHRNVKVSKKKPKWLKTLVLKNLFKRKKHVVRSKSYSDSNKTKKIGKTHRIYQSKKAIIPSPSQSSFTSNESDTGTGNSSGCESDQTITELDEAKCNARKTAKKDTISEDASLLKDTSQSVDESFCERNSSEDLKMHKRNKLKSVRNHTLVRRSSTELLSTCGSFKSISQDPITDLKSPPRKADEKNHYQHKKQSAMSPFQKGLQSSVVNNNEFKPSAVPGGFMSNHHYVSNAENNSKFTTPPASPFWLQSIKQNKTNEETFEPYSINKSFPFATTQRIASNPSSKSSTPRSRRKRRQRQQKPLKNSLNTPPQMTLPSNRKDESPANSNRAHYLVVEVVYHGRSLEAKEKALIQTQVAQLVDELLKKPSPLSQSFALSRENTKPEITKTEGTQVSYKASLDYENQDSDKFYEAESPGTQQQQRLSTKKEEDKKIEQSSLAKTIPLSESGIMISSPNRYNDNPNASFLQDSGPQCAFQSTDMNQYCPENEFNELVSKSQFSHDRKAKPSDSVDYIKYPDLRPAYVVRNPTSFEDIEKKLSNKQTSHTNRRKPNRQPHNGHTSELNYMNGYGSVSIRPPVPLPRQNYLPHSNSVPKLQSPMTYKEQAQFQPYYNRADILSSPALMSLKGYSSSITNESPYNTPSGTPANFARSLESPMCYYQTPELDHDFDADDERFLSPLNASADMKISQTSIPSELEMHLFSQRNSTLNLPPSSQRKNSRSATSLSSSRSRRCKQSASPAEHNAWWMPREWAQERRIGAFGKDWSFEDDEENERKKALKLARKPNVEKIRTCNFVRL